MNRHERRAQRVRQREHLRNLPGVLAALPPDQWPNAFQNLAHRPEAVWLSRDYLVELWREHNPAYPGLLRLSICRARIQQDGHWEDGLTWDELQAIKHEVGFGSWQAIELYPPDDQVVNVANFRHLYLLPVPLDIGFGK